MTTKCKGISPRFNDELEIRYIIIHTGYNNRALSDIKCVNIMREQMNRLSECQLENLETSFTNENDEYIKTSLKSGDVYIVPPERNIRLLYTHHLGYTWIDQDQDEPIYYNNNNTSYVNKVKTSLDELSCASFVFELSENTQLIFKDMLNFSNELTEMKFCGFFCPSTLYDVQYYKKKKAIVFKYDTESG